MTVDQAITTIEGPDFGFDAGLASGLRHFQQIIYHQPATRALLGHARSATDAQRQIFMRALDLANALHDPRYENPSDAIIATYLWILSHVAPRLAAIAAEPIAGSHGYWWARKIAEAALFGLPEHSDSPTALKTVGPSERVSAHQTDLPHDEVLIGTLVGARPRFRRLDVWPEPDLSIRAA